MYFYKNLYVGPSIDDPEKVKRKLIYGAGQFTIYVIALSPSVPGPGSNQLEILHCVNLQQPYYKKYPPYIIGIAEGRTEAVELVRDLVQESYEHTGKRGCARISFPSRNKKADTVISGSDSGHEQDRRRKSGSRYRKSRVRRQKWQYFLLY